MKKRALAGVIALALFVAGCGKLLDLIDDAEKLCVAEARAHASYLILVAPRRTAAQVAKAVEFHGKVQKACDEGGTLDQIRAAIKAAESARD